MATPNPIRPFEVLFDHAETSPIDDEAYAPYGNFGFPAPPADRPWIYSNFVQSLDGITTLLGKHGSGGEISQSREDRWLMDLLRAHADGLLMGMNTMLEEQRSRGPESRGIVFQVADPKLRELRQRLGKGRERNIFVTRAADLDLSRYKVFDGDVVDAAVLTSPAGAARLRSQGGHSHVAILAPVRARLSTCRWRFANCAKSWAWSICCAKAGRRSTAVWRAPIWWMRSS